MRLWADGGQYSYDEVKDVKQPCGSAPIVSQDGQPAFKVMVDGAETVLTAHAVAVKFLRVLLGYATDFLGRPVTDAVLAVPTGFSDAQGAALKKVAEEAGIRVLQEITETAAALTAYSSLLPTGAKSASSLDQTRVVVDVGATSTHISVVAVRDGMYVPLSAVHDDKLGGEQFDEKLMDFFSKEFTKKTKVNVADHRALMKLRLAVESTKKSLSASSSAHCSIESLAEGLDFHSTVNRLRFDLLSGSLYGKITSLVLDALKKADVDPLRVDDFVLVGGTTWLPALSDKLQSISSAEPTVSAQIDPDTVISRGAALEGLALSKTHPLDDDASRQQLERLISSTEARRPRTLARPLGLRIPASDDKTAVDGHVFVTLLADATPLPCRRLIELPARDKALVSLWEGSHDVHVEAPPPREKTDDDDSEEEDDEDEEIRTAFVRPTQVIAEVVVDVADDRVGLTIEIDAAGKGSLTARSAGEAKATF